MAGHRHKNVIDEFEARGLSRRSAAKKIGWEYGTFCRALSRGIASVTMLEAVADFLGWTTDQVLGREKASETE